MSLPALTNNATAWKRGAKGCPKDFNLEKHLKNIAQHIADYNKKPDAKRLDTLDVEIQKAVAAAQKINKNAPPANVKEATTDAVNELADLGKLIDAEQAALGKTLGASRQKIAQFIDYRHKAVASAQTLATGADTIKKAIIERIQSISAELAAFKKTHPDSYVLVGKTMAAIRRRQTQLQGDYAGLVRTVDEFTNAQNKEHRGDSIPLKKYKITDPVDIALATSLDKQDGNWTKMDAYAKQADATTASIAPLLNKLEILIEAAESRMEERNEFYTESLDKTIAMLAAAKAGMTKALGATQTTYGKNYADTGDNSWSSLASIREDLEATPPLEVEAKKRDKLKTIEKVHGELQTKTKDLVALLTTALEAHALALKKLPKNIPPAMYKKQLDALDAESGKVNERLRKVQLRYPEIQKTTDEKIAFIKNYKADDALPVGQHIKAAAFSVAGSDIAKNKTVKAFCTAKEFTQYTLTGQKPQIDPGLVKIQKNAAAKLKNLETGIATLEKLRKQKMKKAAAKKAVQDAIYAIGDASGTMSDGLQAQLRYWAGRCADIYHAQNDTAALAAHNAGKTTQIAAALGGALNDFAQQLNRAEAALDQS